MSSDSNCGSNTNASVRIALDDADDRALTLSYLDQRREELKELRSALQGGDFEALWIAGHRMHGAGGAFGVPQLSSLGAAIEFSAWERDPSKLAEQLQELEAFLGRVEIV
jgi:HPt (histidine-containing phosphotransfer) domain-containing protein